MTGFDRPCFRKFTKRMKNQFLYIVAAFLLFTCTDVVKAGTPEGIKSAAADKLKAVDLGLSVKWANANLDACAPYEYGDYYAWGETEPKDDYSWLSYKLSKGWYRTLLKYNNSKFYGSIDNRSVLELEDDAARVNLGGRWRIPTEEEWKELRTKCTWKWIKNYKGTGINGRLVTAVNGNSIFLPASGYTYESRLYDAGVMGCYWSSSLNTSRPNRAGYVYFYSAVVFRGSIGRHFGQSIRPVSE